MDTDVFPKSWHSSNLKTEATFSSEISYFFTLMMKTADSCTLKITTAGSWGSLVTIYKTTRRQSLRVEGVAWSKQRILTAVNLGFSRPEPLEITTAGSWGSLVTIYKTTRRQSLRVEGVVWSKQRILTAVNLGFSRPEPLLLHSNSSSIVLKRLIGPRSRPPTSQKIW
jgi:hypothetical protein